MRDGLYSIIFTTTAGTLGEGACLLRDGVFVAVDFLHGYHGTFAFEGGTLKVDMHVRRHAPHFVSLLPLPLAFDLQWTGAETAQGFMIETLLPGTQVVVRANAVYKEA